MQIKSTANPKSVVESFSSDLIKKLESDAQLDPTTMSQVKAKIEEKQGEVEISQVPNTLVYQIAVLGTLLLALIIVVGAVFQPSHWANFPEFLKLTLSALVGALAGMIVPSRVDT